MNLRSFPKLHQVASVLLVGAMLGVASTQAAERISTNAPSQTDLLPQIQARLVEARAEVGRFAAQGGVTNLPAGATPSEVVEYGMALEALARTYQQHLEEVATLGAARELQRDTEQAAKAWTGFADPPPYSLLLVDDLRDSIQSLTAKITAGETTQDVLGKLAADLQQTLKASDAQLRRLAEELENAKDTSQTSSLTWHRTLEQTRNRLLLARVALNESRRQRTEVEQAERRQNLALVRRQLLVASHHSRFSQLDLDQVLSSLDAERRELETELHAAELEAEARQKTLASGRESLRTLLQASSETNAVPAEQKARVRQVEDLIELRTAQAETSARRVSALGQLLDLIFAERGLWEMRFATVETDDVRTLHAAYARLERVAALIHTVKPHFLQQIEVATSQMTEQQNRIQNRALAEDATARLRELLEQYRQREEIARRALRGVDKLERLALRWRESLDQDRASLPLTGRVKDLFSSFSGFAAKLWNFELFAAEDTITVDGQSITGRRSVTVAKIVNAILILTIGYWLAIFLARFLERLAVRRLKVEPNQANLVRRWAHVVMVIGLVLFSLVLVKIPLTVFAFLGGALAIGLGFGTQNLLKNFISGIIILFERPFRVGDVLDVGGQRGVVNSVGIRSSVLKLWDGTETLIPNSALLENNLTNWTYSDRKVRFALKVGVAYGSNTRRVAQLLSEVAQRHGLVQKDPEPQVLFQDFADSALTFELRYWVDVLKHNSAQVGSDLRHMIAGVFAENGISIAFPQQDIHLVGTKPLRVQMLAPDANKVGDGSPTSEAAEPPATKTDQPQTPSRDESKVQ